MDSRLPYIDSLLVRHRDEAEEGLVDASPSRLKRGQGTERYFYILKIDLVGSTIMLMGKRRVTYLKLAHIFLSTVDKITEERGADPAQTEYAGDSVIAYFPETVGADQVFVAACEARKAVERIALLGGAVGSLNPKCKIVLHFAPLIVAKIGPRANSVISAIGHPIHRVAKIEKDIRANVIRATVEFYQLVNKGHRRFFSEVYTEKQEPIAPVYQPSTLQIPTTRSLAELLYAQSNPTPPTVTQYKTVKTTHGYDLLWKPLERALELH